MAGQAVLAIKDRQWMVNVATLPWELVQGLGGLPELPAGTGMLFDLGWEQEIQVTTMPMLFSLDIAFLSETTAVTEVYRNIEPGYIVTSTIPARYFLEVNAGEFEGIDSGDKALVEVTLPAQIVIPDWVSSLLSFMGVMVISIVLISLVKGVVKGILEEPEISPIFLPQTSAEGNKYAWALFDRETGEIMIKPGFATESKARRSARDFAARRAKYAGDHPLELRLYDKDPNINRLDEGVIFKSHIQVNYGKVVEEEMEPSVVPIESKRLIKKDVLEFLPDSPEFLAYTIDDIGYRDKIDSAFQQAISRVKRSD